MNTRPVANILTCLMLIVAPFAAVNSATAAALPTAKTGLAAATAAAHTWQADAVLVVVETSSAEPDGSAYAWMYLFDSPGSKQQAIVIVDDKGGVDVTPTSIVSAFRKPLGDFADSDRAMAAAVTAGMKTNNYGMKMSLTMSERLEWFMSDRDYSYTIDGATGKFLKKEE